jgi:plasmid stabilization system protein ParE
MRSEIVEQGSMAELDPSGLGHHARIDIFYHQPEEALMSQGDKSAYTDKQKRKARHIEEGYEREGVPTDEAERRAWATVNKQDGGGKKSGSGRRRKPPHKASREDRSSDTRK